MVSVLGFAYPPEPTDWCNVRFAVAITGREAPVLVWLGWDNDLALAAEDVGNDEANAAFRFVDHFRRTEVVAVHCLLSKAREAYRQSGENDSVGHIPTPRFAQAPMVEADHILFVFQMEGEVLTGRLSDALAWTCSTRDPRLWSTARHAAIEYALSHLTSLDANAFDTSALRRGTSNKIVGGQP